MRGLEPFAPELSVVILTRDRYEACRRTIGCLSEQTARERIELVLVAPSRSALAPDEDELADFGGYQVCEVGELRSTGAGLAAGTRVAGAPLVVYGEEHSYPEPGWAQALIDGHRGPYAAVGCAVGNANPGTLTSWAHLFGQFGPVADPVDSGIATFLAPHHTSYKRDVLLAYGDALEDLLENESALHIDLRAKGHRLYLAGGAVADHVNISRPLAYWRVEFLGMRGFAAARASVGGWSRLHRAAFAAAAPAIPFVRARRIVREIRRAGRARQLLPRVLLVLFPALWCGAAGEAAGYLAGAGRSAALRVPVELDRYSFVSAGDRPRAQP